MGNNEDNDLVAGVLLIALGLFAVVYGQQYEYGSLARMGAGFFPITLGALLLVLSLFILLPALRLRFTWPEFDIRSAALVLISFLLFALTLRRGGLVVSTFLAVTVASCADRNTSWGTRVALATAVSLFSVGVFRFALGMRVPLWWGG